MPWGRSRSASAVRLLGGVVAVACLLAVYAGMGGGAAQAVPAEDELRPASWPSRWASSPVFTLTWVESVHR